jgi:hypothetical protein
MSDDEEYEYDYGSDADYDYGSDAEQENLQSDDLIEIENLYYGKPLVHHITFTCINI